jgi:3D (Asp-Asp-Asp) domain-containing protein
MLWLALPARAQDEPKRISAHLGNEIIPLDSNATTVGGFLAELSITLPPGAHVDPPLDSALRDGMSVFLAGLTVTRGTADQIIPVETKVSESWQPGPARIATIDHGSAGLARVSYTIFYHDGHEVGRREHREVLKRMRPKQVVYYYELGAGDGPTVQQILSHRAKPGPHHTLPSRWKEVLTMSSTAYEPGPQSCGKFASGMTSAGYAAGYGVVAVDPDVIPLGTRLYIEGYGYAVAGDRGGSIDGKRIDVGFETVDECYDWGRREVKVYILY